MIDFIMSHQALVAGVVVAVLDFAIALNKNLEQNSIIQLVLSFFKGKLNPPAPPAA